MSKTKHHGFSLIELLVVLVVIAVLAAVLVPVLIDSKRSAKVASCLSNEKQIYQAVYLYSQDNGGTTPPGVWRKDDDTVVTWDTLVMKYAKNNKGIFKCPGDVTKGTRSYAINDQLIRRLQNFSGRGMSFSDVPSSSKYVVFAEFHNDESVIGGDKYAMAYFAPDDKQQYHDGGHNFAFFDGHVKHHKFGQITNGNFILNIGD